MTVTRVVALTFHDVVADGAGSLVGNDAFYSIEASGLEQLLSRLHRLRYQTVSSKAFRAWQEGKAALPERAVVLTFDDGYASHFRLVAPLLIRHRFSGTFFVCVDRVGRPGYATWDQLRKLIFLGMEIGSHGFSHRPLTALSAEELNEELVRSKQILEEHLGVPIRALAAPGGFWDKRVAEATQNAGYDAVWVSRIGTNGRETYPHALRRVVVRQPLSVTRVISMVEGWRPSFWYAGAQQYLIRMLKRALGVYWYEKLKHRLVPEA
ncbi:MAG: polysaccharide deacetylase family protein [Nitrososphaera sp.]|nr:polysaccharide deacetylase family protein [Nitrososphaera sp.]